MSMIMGGDLRRESLYQAAAFLGLLIVVCLVLSAQGRVWWCPAGDLRLWSWDIWTIHNSQHVLDPYSLTHLLHGVAEFFLIRLIFPRLSWGWCLIIATLIEGSWEVVENTNYVINKYRDETISLNYFGDSIINSLSDVLCCAVGFTIGSRLGFRRSLALFIVTEVILIFWIHDSLIINIIMLLHPFDAIKAWQISH